MQLDDNMTVYRLFIVLILTFFVFPQTLLADKETWYT